MISRTFLAAVWLAVSLRAAPPLTTIQDVLYKADGSRYNGALTISWSSFEAIDRSAIAQQVKTVTVVNGNLQVQLVPTTTATPAAFYTVVYNSDGRIQFQETWAVPSSVQALRIRDVRFSIAGAALPRLPHDSRRTVRRRGVDQRFGRPSPEGTRLRRRTCGLRQP